MNAALWTLVGILGLGRILYVVGKRVTEDAKAGIEAFERPTFDVFAFDALPPAVARTLTPLRAGFLALGFRELLSYSRRGPRSNYTVVLLAENGLTAAHLWVAQHKGLMKWLTLLAGWRAFTREVTAAARFGLITEFPGARRFETSPVEILAQATVKDAIEFLIVDVGTSLADAARLHEEAAGAFAKRIGAEPIRVETEAQFFDIQRGNLARLAEKLRRQFAAPGV